MAGILTNTKQSIGACGILDNKWLCNYNHPKRPVSIKHKHMYHLDLNSLMGNLTGLSVFVCLHVCYVRMFVR